MRLDNLQGLKTREAPKKRVGRGIGSGKGGHTSGRGMKGQKARKGNSKPWLGFEGGQVPLYKRLPRIHRFKGNVANKPLVLSLSVFNNFEDGATVTPLDLVKSKIIKSVPSTGIKVLANGKLTKKINLNGFKYSETALALINKSGSTIDGKIK